jgi:tetratricopeptide (TPR) repeat protein
MGIGTHPGALRTGLVAFLLVFGFAVACAQDNQPSAQEQEVSAASEGKGLDLRLKERAEVEDSECKQRYANPLNLLFLLPGLLFFVFALVTGNYRKPFLFFSLLLLLGPTKPDRFALVQKAQESFASGHYRQAMETYSQAEKLLPCNSAVLYNLGVVSHYLGQPGYAVHYLRRALRLAPADRQVRRALLAVELRYDLAGQVAPPFPVHPDVAYLLLLVFANVAFVIGAFVVRTKKVQFLISLVLVAIVALGCLTFLLGLISVEARSVGVVISAQGAQGELFRVPEEDSKSWFELPEGTSLFVRGRSGGYYLVETQSKIEGWVKRETILID